MKQPSKRSKFLIGVSVFMAISLYGLTTFNIFYEGYWAKQLVDFTFLHFLVFLLCIGVTSISYTEDVESTPKGK